MPSVIPSHLPDHSLTNRWTAQSHRRTNRPSPHSRGAYSCVAEQELELVPLQGRRCRAARRRRLAVGSDVLLVGRRQRRLAGRGAVVDGDLYARQYAIGRLGYVDFDAALRGSGERSVGCRLLMRSGTRSATAADQMFSRSTAWIPSSERERGRRERRRIEKEK